MVLHATNDQTASKVFVNDAGKGCKQPHVKRVALDLGEAR